MVFCKSARLNRTNGQLYLPSAKKAVKHRVMNRLLRFILKPIFVKWVKTNTESAQKAEETLIKYAVKRLLEGRVYQMIEECISHYSLVRKEIKEKVRKEVDKNDMLWMKEQAAEVMTLSIMSRATTQAININNNNKTKLSAMTSKEGHKVRIH